MSIKYVLFMFVIFNTSVFALRIQPHHQVTHNKPLFKVMIDPAGDVYHKGRKIDDSFERSLTMHFAEELKKELALRNIQVILTRCPGEAILPLQNAQFANRAHVDLFMTINFYQEYDVIPHLYLYHFSYNPLITCAYTELAFYPFDQAYLINAPITRTWIHLMHTLLEKNYEKLFQAHTPIACPVSALIGITAPAITCEMGLKQKGDWELFIAPLVTCIETLCHQMHTL